MNITTTQAQDVYKKLTGNSVKGVSMSVIKATLLRAGYHKVKELLQDTGNDANYDFAKGVSKDSYVWPFF